MGEELKAKVGDMVLSDGQWYEVIDIEAADKDGLTSEYFCMPKDGPEVYLTAGDIEAVYRGEWVQWELDKDGEGYSPEDTG